MARAATEATRQEPNEGGRCWVAVEDPSRSRDRDERRFEAARADQDRVRARLGSGTGSVTGTDSSVARIGHSAR